MSVRFHWDIIIIKKIKTKLNRKNKLNYHSASIVVYLLSFPVINYGHVDENLSECKLHQLLYINKNILEKYLALL